jgi:adenylate cyclase
LPATLRHGQSGGFPAVHALYAYAHFFAGRFDEAALSASRAAQANPQFSIPWVLRTASLANLGRREETQASAQRLRELWPSFTISEYLGSNFTSPERLAMFDEALRLAGLPDG